VNDLAVVLEINAPQHILSDQKQPTKSRQPILRVINRSQLRALTARPLIGMAILSRSSTIAIALTVAIHEEANCYRRGFCARR
jgi:hypothetical protein